MTIDATPQLRTPSRMLTRRRSCLVLMLAPLACIIIFLLGYFIFPPSPTDMVILGVDARPGEGYLTRTDAVILLNITPGKARITMLSIPRDVFIQVPNYGEQRINTINALGEQETRGSGPELVKASFQESFGVKVENYIRLDFSGFVAVIDAVGGVDIQVPKLIIDYEYPTLDGGTITVRFDPGEQHMDGERALQYARTRHQDDDYQRAARQQQVVDALMEKLTNPLNVVQWPGVWRAIQKHTNTDLNTWDIIRLGPAVVLGWSGKNHRVLQREDLIGMKAGYWVPNYDQIMPWITKHFN